VDGGLPVGAVVERWNRSPEAEIPARAEAIASGNRRLLRRPNRPQSQPRPRDRPHIGQARLPRLPRHRRRPSRSRPVSGTRSRGELCLLDRDPAGLAGSRLGAHITRSWPPNSLAEGVDLIYLGVYTENTGPSGYTNAGFRDPGRNASADMLKTLKLGHRPHRPYGPRSCSRWTFVVLGDG